MIRRSGLPGRRPPSAGRGWYFPPAGFTAGSAAGSDVPAAGSDAGTGTIELVLLAPIVVLFLLLMVVLGRIAETGAEVTGAARDAARAASMARTPGSAANAAHTAAATALAGENIDCSTGVSVSVNTSRWFAGGSVRVTVACTVRLSDVGFSMLPGSKRMTASATAPLERFRGVG
ncbi:MAG: TadE/TadG family type IV pilus assembly protein [Actinomycetes bacterium]